MIYVSEPNHTPLKNPSPQTAAVKNSAAMGKLSSLFGGEKQDEKPKIHADGEKKFCRDCMHLVSHPFLTRCSLHAKEVNPMDDCPDFKSKVKNEK
jgi:hypothetical protein